jgi:hypothetical protein
MLQKYRTSWLRTLVKKAQSYSTIAVILREMHMRYMYIHPHKWDKEAKRRKKLVNGRPHSEVSGRLLFPDWIRKISGQPHF